MPEISDEELEKFKSDSKRALDLEASKKRLEEENTKYKDRAKDAEGKLSDAEKAKLEAEGNIQSLLDVERAEKVKLQDKLTANNKSTLREKLRNEVSIHAKDAHNIDMIIKVTEHKDLLKLDESDLTVEGVKEYVEKVRETHGYLFTKKTLDNGDKIPPNNKDDFDNKNSEEKYREELRNCKDRKSMNDVRKKYGKAID